MSILLLILTDGRYVYNVNLSPINKYNWEILVLKNVKNLHIVVKPHYFKKICWRMVDMSIS